MKGKSGLFKFLDIPAGALGDYPDLAHDLCVGRFDVCIVRGVFAQSTMKGVLERILRSEHGMIITPQQNSDPDVEQVTMYGVGITPNAIHHRGEPPDKYHSSAVHFRAACQHLFHGFEDYESRMLEIFGRLSGGRAIEVPRDPQGRIYTPATIRKVPPGREMNMHVGNYFLTTPAYAHLVKLFAPLDQLSFFIPLALPDSGGQIDVYELQYGDPRTPLTSDGYPDGAFIQRNYRFERYTPGQGDLFLFNGGKYYHRVNHVAGKSSRWTIGGFMSFGNDRPVLYYWS